jgi:hypothetical protein
MKNNENPDEEFKKYLDERITEASSLFAEALSNYRELSLAFMSSLLVKILMTRELSNREFISLVKCMMELHKLTFGSALRSGKKDLDY